MRAFVLWPGGLTDVQGKKQLPPAKCFDITVIAKLSHIRSQELRGKE